MSEVIDEFEEIGSCILHTCFMLVGEAEQNHLAIFYFTLHVRVMNAVHDQFAMVTFKAGRSSGEIGGIKRNPELDKAGLVVLLLVDLAFNGNIRLSLEVT